MAFRRLKLTGSTTVYHCLARVAGADPLLTDDAKQKLVELIRQVARFCGIELLTYCVMSNHFHVLVRVPVAEDIPDEEILARMQHLYGEDSPNVRLARETMEKSGHIPRDQRDRLLARMGDISQFMKEVKQRFSRWFNRRHDRRGTLWSERFKSVVVEDHPGPVSTMAAYIDLNPVRAGLVKDPKDYRFCGYAAALAGDKTLRAGIMSFHPDATEWRQASAEYRKRMFPTDVRGRKPTLDREAIKRAAREGRDLHISQVLRLRIRHMSDGMALGSKEFLEDLFRQNRKLFSAGRKSGARPIRGVPLEELNVLRDLRVRAIT